MAGTIPSAPLEAAPGGASAGSLPWRGPGDGRPDLPLPPERLPLLHRGQLRKQWRYVGFYGEELMLCAAVAKIGPFSHTFWSLWDRTAGEGEGRAFGHTRLRPGNPEVRLDGPTLQIRTREVNADLDLEESRPIEVVHPSGRGWGWTRKRAGVPMSGRVQIGGKSFEVQGFGVDDESAGFHARHTAWYWSAGVGVATDGRALGWNFVEGVNDTPTKSERAIWVDGVPGEPGQVTFRDLDAVVFDGGRSRDSAPAESGTADPSGGILDFESSGVERRRDDNFGLIRSHYVHRFGTFTGSLDGIELASGSGVMEEHRVVW